jgi:DNA-directed RNA polymerase subunit RPC12/RpoP
MPFHIECPSCGHRATLPDSFVGTEIQCPRCLTHVVPLTSEKMENYAAKVLFAAPAAKEEVIKPEAEGPEVPFVCPFCGEAYQVSEDLAGKTITCRNCREPSRVDAPGRKKLRVRRERFPWQLVWFCAALALGSLLVGFLLGRM